MAIPIRVNEDNYVELQRRADLNRRSIIGELNYILDNHFGRSTAGSSDDFRPADLEPVGKPPVAAEPQSVSEVVHNGITEGEKMLRDTQTIRCTGKHYMSRQDCGKPGCPWRKL